MPEVIKNRAIHLQTFAGFCFINISAPPNFDKWALSLPNSRNEEMMGDAFGAAAAGRLEQ